MQESYRVILGYLADGAITSGSDNIALGFNALGTLQTGSDNVAIGNGALSGVGTGSGTTANIAIGASANSNQSGIGNVTVGYGSLNTSTTSATYNTLLGTQNGQSITSGGSNLVLGYNVAVTTLKTGSNNILLGNSSAVDVPANATSYWLNIGKAILNDMDAPTIGSGFGTSPSVTHGTSNAAFTVNVGTGGTATSGVINFTNAAPNGWVCTATDVTSYSTIVDVVVPTSTTSVTMYSYSRTTGLSTAWNASDIQAVQCHGY